MLLEHFVVYGELMCQENLRIFSEGIVMNLPDLPLKGMEECFPEVEDCLEIQTAVEEGYWAILQRVKGCYLSVEQYQLKDCLAPQVDLKEEAKARIVQACCLICQRGRQDCL